MTSEIEQMAESAKTLDGALCWLQAHLPRVAKGERADVVKDGKKLYSYDYADLTDVTEALFPLMATLGLTWRCMPTLTHLDGEASWRLVMEYRLQHISGADIHGVVPLPDRADPQIIGSSMTYWRRYLLCAVTGLAPGGDDDGTAAKEGSRQGERMSAASELSLPPGDTERLVAMLEPQALTPLADYPTLWEKVACRRAGDKPSPIEHDGKILSWAELFGFSLAQRINHLDTPDACRAFFNEAKAAGGDAALRWTWEGKLPGARLRERGQRVKEHLEERTRVLEHAITSAETLEELRAARALADAEHLLSDHFDPARSMALVRLIEQHHAKLERQTATSAAPPPAEEAPQESGERYATLKAQIWKGDGTGRLRDELLGTLERGEIFQEDYAELFTLLGDRPEPGPLPPAGYDYLFWQAAQAPNEVALDEVRDRTKELRVAGELSELEERSILATVSATRIEMRGERYR